jgi:hypothetical protein
MVSYAIYCGVAPMAAVSVYSVEGLAGLGGRLLLGLLGDRFGAKPVLIVGLLVQALAIGSYVFVSRLGELYALAVIFGTACGGVMLRAGKRCPHARSFTNTQCVCLTHATPRPR